MSPRSKLILRFFAILVAGTLALAVHHKATTGSWTVPWIFIVVVFLLAALSVGYYGDPERANRLQSLRNERMAQRQREIEEAKNLPS